MPPNTAGFVDCASTNDGRPLQVTVSYTKGGKTAKSTAVTMRCAGYPLAPPAPKMLLGNRDIITVEWELPAADGGSPVLGFFLFMKRADDVEYTLI